MAQGVNTVRPGANGLSVLENLNGWTVTGGGGTAVGATSDNSDASYITQPASNGPFSSRKDCFIPIAPPPALPSNQSVKYVQVRIRWDSGVGGSSQANTLVVQVGSSYHYGNNLGYSIVSAIEDQLTDPLIGAPATIGGQQNPLNPNTNLQWLVGYSTGSGDFSYQIGGAVAGIYLGTVWFSGARQYRIYEIYVDYFYDDDPTVAWNSALNVGSYRPTAQFNLTDTEADPYVEVETYWYTAAQYGAGGFVAGTSPGDAHVDTVVPPTSTTPIGAQPNIDLTNGTTYKVAMRIKQSANARWSAWVLGSAFTVSVIPPAVPTIAATVDNALGRIKLDVQGRDNLLTYNNASFETDVTGFTGTNATLSRITTQFLHGAASMQLASVAAGNMSALGPNGVNGAPVTVGQQYTAMASFRRVSGGANRLCHIDILWYTAAGALISTSAGGTTSINASWTQVTNTATAPATAAFAAVRVQVDGPTAAAEQFAVDQVDIGPGSSTVWTPGGIAATTGYAGLSSGTGQTILIERSLDGGTTWTQIRPQPASTLVGAIPQASIALGVQTSTVYDYEVPLGTNAIYRARTVAIYASADAGNPVPGNITNIASANSASTGAVQLTGPTNGMGWYLKDPANPTRNMAIDIVEETWKIKRPVVGAQFQPLGRADPLVVQDIVAKAKGSCTFEFVLLADYNSFVVLFESLNTLLLQRYDGTQYYIEFVVSGDLEEWNTNPIIRRMAMNFAEVVAP